MESREYRFSSLFHVVEWIILLTSILRRWSMGWRYIHRDSWAEISNRFWHRVIQSLGARKGRYIQKSNVRRFKIVHFESHQRFYYCIRNFLRRWFRSQWARFDGHGHCRWSSRLQSSLFSYRCRERVQSFTSGFRWNFRNGLSEYLVNQARNSLVHNVVQPRSRFSQSVRLLFSENWIRINFRRSWLFTVCLAVDFHPSHSTRSKHFDQFVDQRIKLALISRLVFHGRCEHFSRRKSSYSSTNWINRWLRN